MSDLNKLEFREILEDSNPVAIVDARKYPDFFGFYRSTQFALQSFEQLSIQYVHAPLHFSENGKAEDLWEVRQSATIALQKVRSQLDLFGNTCLMLTSSAFSRAHSERLLLSLSVFSRDWRLDVV
ncbi:hypothetical protein [Sulfitobacter sp. SH24]|uniref:hypothetical protein n=1 Tax=Sulfitobacter sp. SH24 TaxID=3421173 RepID=UPI003F501689